MDKSVMKIFGAGVLVVLIAISACGVDPIPGPHVKSWGTAIKIESAPGNAYQPVVAFDSSGNAVVLWCQDDGNSSTNHLMANVLNRQTGWSTPVVVNNNYLGNAEKPQIVFDDTGIARAVWMEVTNFNYYDIYSAHYSRSSGWSTPLRIKSSTNTAFDPRIAVDASGNAFCIWQEYDGLRWNIRFNQYTNAMGWGNDILIETNSGDAQYPYIAVDPSGNATAIWKQFDGVHQNVMASHLSSGNIWDNPIPIENGTGEVYNLQIANDKTGHVLAVWRQYDGIFWNLMANMYTNGVGWGTDHAIETNAGDAFFPVAAFDSEGNAMVVWQQSNGSIYRIWANYYSVMTGWSDAVLLETEDLGNAQYPQVAFYPNGDALAVWYQNDGSRYNIVACEFSKTTGWGIAFLMENDNSGSAGSPRIAIDNDGNAVVVWTQDDGVYNNVWARRYH